MLWATTEGPICAPETSHAIACAIDEAEKALRKASQLAPDGLAPKIHLILLEIHRGNHSAAYELARTLRSETKLDAEADKVLEKALRGEF